jgi:hypothetical protein
MVHLAHGGVRAGLARHAFGPVALVAVAAVAFGVDLGAWLRARPGRSNRWRIATGLAAAAWTGYALVRMVTTRPAVDPPTGLQLRAG